MVTTRSQARKLFKPSKEMAAIIIQRNYRKYLNNRYKNLKNYDDKDLITLSSIKLIPKESLLVINKRGCDGPNLIKWINSFNAESTPVHPYYRTKFNNTEMKKIIKFGMVYIKNLRISKDDREDFSNVLYEMISKEIIRNYN